MAELCGAGGADCLSESGDVWSQIQGAAEEAYDRSSACEFTSFVAYEWSGATNVSNYHRNVIFRNHVVPELPTSYFEEPTSVGLWQALQRDCLDGVDGCDVLAIPHNSNYSNGNLFQPFTPAGEDEGEWAAFRASMEPLVEIYQHKGDSECIEGVSGILGTADELCGFEKVRPQPIVDCGDAPGSGGMATLGCVHRLDSIRGVLLEGMKEELRTGVNPYRLGIIASTDTHSGTPGMVQEDGYVGHLGMEEGTAANRLKQPDLNPGGHTNSPGGLTAVWAEENSRDALFDALRRREVYGTSGPRIALRFFAGWELSEQSCSDADWVASGYDGGVPMGGVLQGGAGQSPVFVAQALRDAGTATRQGTPLQRIQIVKGWIDAEGKAQISIADLAGGDNEASVNLDTCALEGGGSDSLCGSWVDPDFDATQPAFYYVRVVENPTCRWSWRDCLSMPADERPEACFDEGIPQRIQERAWSSPIWVGL